MVETVGTKLRRARTLRQISLDDAARATKIRIARLSDLESDVYTNFPDTAYAKGFLTSYGRYLGVDVKPFLDAFEDTHTFGLNDYQYLSAKPLGMYRVSRRPQPRVRRKGRWRWMATVSTFVLLPVGLFLWVLVNNLQRLDLGKLADHQEEREHLSKAKGKGAATPSAKIFRLEPLLTLEEKRLLSGAGAGPSGLELVMAEHPFFFSPSGTVVSPVPRAPFLPLSGDGSILREMTLGSSYAFSLPKEADRTNASGTREGRSNAMAPGNALGHRFFVHTLGGDPADALEEEARQAPVRVNNSLE